METLKLADQRKISSFVRQLYCLDTINNFSQRVVRGLERLISGNRVSMMLLKRKTQTAHMRNSA
jgi:hypothetical protein